MSFPIFTPEYARFFRELAANNHKDWFDANRKIYENLTRKPFIALVEGIRQHLLPFMPELGAFEARQLLFRINRDVRFSKDKSPYKPHLSAAFSSQGKTGDFPGYYLQMGAEGIWIGGGAYQMDKDSLFKVRQEIVYNPEEFESLIKDKTFVQHYEAVKGEKNKRLPPEFREDGEKIPLLYNKSFYFMRELPPEAIEAPDLLATLTSHIDAGRAFNAFLIRALEPPSTESEPWPDLRVL